MSWSAFGDRRGVPCILESGYIGIEEASELVGDKPRIGNPSANRGDSLGGFVLHWLSSRYSSLISNALLQQIFLKLVSLGLVFN